ncbi:MAG: 4'-phosphopantetheinyl transferase superfamily protein [Ruminococcus sp.]|nr:4'-phosphopantetheinyl transferase superfamily protein [Ruminococcus sp.]
MIIKYIMIDENTSFEDIKPYLPLLPKERREKIARYRFDKDKLTSAVAGLLIRHMIGDRELIYGEHNKPYIKNCDDLFFSVSHSDRCVAIAVDDTEVGVDVEKIRTKDIDKLAERFFSQGEIAYIAQSSDKPVAFTEVWTRKEAYLKCKGTGITEDLSAFDTTSDDLNPYLYSAKLEGYYLSVCSKEEFDINKVYFTKLELKMF